jgi:sarcosine oxidase
MTLTYDVAIVGLGAMGSATAYTLARRGRRVVAFDTYAPPHAHGSSHGKTRIIREAYYEHPVYVPLLRRAFEAWHEVERASGQPLYRRTGGIMIGPPNGELVTGALASVTSHSIPHRVLSANGIRRMFPALQPLDDWVGVLERRAGVLFPEQCVTAFHSLAARAGADLRLNERVTGWRAGPGAVVVTTTSGTFTASQLVIAAGPWVHELAPHLGVTLLIERQLAHWLAPSSHSELFGPDHFPIALWEYSGDRIFASQPDFGSGVKVGMHHDGESTDPDTVDRTVHPHEDAQVLDLARRFLPFARGRVLDRSVCLYTNTRDHNFLIDFHPAHGNVLVLSPCSGHGFKFSVVIGEIAADLLAGVQPPYDLSPFRIAGRG